MNFHPDDGPPCRNMENLIQGLADGSLKGPKKWYAAAHAAQCPHCGTFLQRMQITIEAVRTVKSEPGESHAVPGDTLIRLRAKIAALEGGSA